jgi:two-component system chemotaxis response regulator CheB
MLGVSMGRIRVAVVDDSSFVRAALARIIGADARFLLVGQAGDGPAAIELAARERPDVMTMDFQMPGMTGDEVVRRIVAAQGTPIVMLSAHTSSAAPATIAALAAGAVDVVMKPSGEVSLDLAKIGAELLEKLAQAALAKPRARHGESEPPPSSRSSIGLPPASRPSFGPASIAPAATSDRVIIVGASTGGPAALESLVVGLPTGCALAMVIVQHMSASLTPALAQRLDGLGRLRVREARDGDRPEPGVALVAPGDRHMVFVPGGRLQLRDDPPMHGVRPAVDVTLKSAASTLGARAIGVVLTGMGRDGALGLAAIKAAGGRTIAQDQGSSVVYGMPRAAIELGVVDEVAPLAQIAPAIYRALGRR